MQRTIPQTDPRANYLAHQAEIDEALAEALLGGRYILGPQVSAFESEFAAYLGLGYTAGVASGTDALELALRACGITAGQPVFTVSHTAVATVAAVERCGAIPVLVDIDLNTYTMDPAHLEEAIKSFTAERPSASAARHASSRWGAILPVHLYGHPASILELREVAERHGLWLVEDCAQAHGATVGTLRTGTLGHIAAFSFYPTKNLGALGDGGLVATDDLYLAQRVRALREYGWQERYISQEPGQNSRLDELQAAILRVKLRYLDAENAKRSRLAGRYGELLADAGVVMPTCRTGMSHVYHQYVIRCEDRDALRAYLREHGAVTLIHYPIPVHLQPAYRQRLPGSTALPVTERVAGEILSLPMYAELDPEDVQSVARLIERFTQHH